MPRALLIQYMVITITGVLLYYSCEEQRWSEFKAPILALLRERRLWPVRWALLGVVPALAAYAVYGMVKPSLDAPVELRQVHPAPPSTLRVYGKSLDLARLENPKRNAVLELMDSSPDEAWDLYRGTVEAGRDIYYRNCFFCHGDLLDGEGPYAPGFNPLPINFQDVGTIAQLQEAFLFWRITTGGPGLPREGTPWNSAMPVWHEMLDEDQVWDVITFLYDYVGQVPRMWDAEISSRVASLKERVLAERATMDGRALYRLRCAVCHGAQGAGDGVAAEFMYPRPRDFTLALFKYKSSPPGELPRDEDLFRTIKFGLPGTGMPGWGSLLSDGQIRSLIPVIKGFDITASWAPEDAGDELFDDEGRYTGSDFRVITAQEPLSGRVAYTGESVARGRELFGETCAQCHGGAGRGNITSGKRLTDDWGERIWPRDLSKPWSWRATEAGSRDATIGLIYQRLSIGIPGTPMPAHRAVEEGNEDPVSLEDRWHIANYVYSLREGSVAPGESGVITALSLPEGIPEDPDDPRWRDAPPVALRLVPNVIREERLFTPLNDSITVRAVYDDRHIAFLLEVNDRTDSRPGEPVSTEIQDENLELYPDAFAIQFPRADAFSSAPVVEKPLYRHGDPGHPVTIWYWNAGSVEPEEPPRALLLEGSGPGKKLAAREGADLQAEGRWQEGRWRVMMKRPRDPGQSGDVPFTEGEFIPISFANWDGSNGEKGSRHTLTTWYWLILPPPVDPLKTYGAPLGTGLLVLLGGLMLVRGQRRPAVRSC
ncbi:MAG TPA: c-type cytochrome [Gammaproteobacteria bacterium]|nr:c-type cytochrome [Gammaproteobacteria bacterium]